MSKLCEREVCVNKHKILKNLRTTVPARGAGAAVTGAWGACGVGGGRGSSMAVALGLALLLAARTNTQESGGGVLVTTVRSPPLAAIALSIRSRGECRDCPQARPGGPPHTKDKIILKTHQPSNYQVIAWQRQKGPIRLLYVPNRNKVIRELFSEDGRDALAHVLCTRSAASSSRSGARATIQDSRCYLMNGGAVESFFISEDTPVGSVIGTLSVNGDPSGDGNISLTLQEKNPAVGIAPFSKNLTLLRALDREEKRGPSNVYVNVRCDRRRTADPTFIIPVSVRVWDVNDNAPVWVGAPYRVRLSELTAVGSRVLHNIRATDADQPGPHATIHYSVLPGPNSEYFGFVNELDSILVVKQPLDYETLPNFTITLRASDNGTPPLYNDTTLRVDVLDADDQNPKFSYDHYTATVPDNAEEGTILETSPGPIVAQDQDVGINAPLYYTVSGEKRDLVMVDKDTGRVAVTRRLLEAVDLPVTVVVKATQVDNADRYALATLWIGRKSAALSRPIRFTRRAFVAQAREDSAPGTVLAVLHTEPMRSPETSPLQFYVSDRSFLEKFAINSAGEVLLRKPLDFETKDSYSYQVMVTDGITNDTASLNITVMNVNEWEPRFRYPQYEFSVDDDADVTLGLLPVGKLDVHDGDAPDTVTLTLRGAHANLFYINESGEMFLRADALNALNSSVLHIVATAVDSGAPPRQTSVPVLVHVGERLMQARTSAARGGVFLLFACALAVLALLVCALLAYIYRNKRRSKTASTASPHTASKSPALSKPHTPQATAVAANNNNAGGTLASSGSLLSVSAGASTILANSSSSLDLRGDTLPNNGNGNGNSNGTPSGRQSTRFPTKSKIAPAPPTHAQPPGHGHAHNDVALMSDHLRTNSSGRSGVAWPSHTIPARVKKLSWDDAAHDHGKVGQRRPKHNPRRDQPHSARPHEPHGLLLTTNPHHPFTNPLRPFHPRLTNPNHPAYTTYSQPTNPNHPTVTPHSQTTSPNHSTVAPYSQPTNPNHPTVTPHSQTTSPNHSTVAPYSQTTNPNHPTVTPQPANPHTFAPYNQLASPKGPNQSTVTIYTPHTNPNHPQFTPHQITPYKEHPQAINHAMIQNLPHSCAPAQAYNSVLIRNYALPNQITINQQQQKSAKKALKITNPVTSNQPQTPNHINTYHNPQNPQLCFIEIANDSNPSHPDNQIFQTQSNLSNANHLLPRILFGTTHPLPNMYQQPPEALPTAPRLSVLDPLAAVLSKTGAGKGPPPEYATIDPRKLRLRTLRPVFTRGSRRGNNSAGSTTKLTKNKNSRSNDDTT
ncbi:hypothetical protein O0L34_g8410 [Tuta absoluta]|nr:hypothetical protein O0L34_g8410 [Tuta absoluta]